MGVGKKIRRILSFKRKKEEKPAIEAPKPEKTNTLNGTKKSNSLMSLTRKFSFGSKDKNKKDKSKKGAPPAPESAAPPSTVATPETTATIPLATPEIVDNVPVAETSKPVSEPAAQQIEVVSNEITIEQLSESENPLFEKMKPVDRQGEDIKDEGACGDSIKNAAGQSNVLSEGQSDKPAAVSSESAEKHCEVLSTVTATEEPKTTTEVINMTHDKSETNQTGDEIVRTVETEQERTLAEDGTTVISRSTKTTTTTVDRGSAGNVSQVKTEIKKEMMPPVSNGHSRQISQRQQSIQKSSSLPLQLIFGLIAVAIAGAVYYALKDSGALSFL